MLKSLLNWLPARPHRITNKLFTILLFLHIHSKAGPASWPGLPIHKVKLSFQATPFAKRQSVFSRLSLPFYGEPLVSSDKINETFISFDRMS